MDYLLILGGLAGFIIGLTALVKGSVRRLHLGSRKHGAWVMAVSFVAVMAGGAIADPVDEVLEESSSDEREVAESVSPGGQTPDSSATATPTPSSPGGFTVDFEDAEQRSDSIPAGAKQATVARNVDGDTIWAEGGTLPAGTASRVRLLEVDTPESTNRTECYGPEASEFTKRELPIGSTIYLLADKEDKDRFGRFLRYVWKADGTFFNETLVREGYAEAVLFMPNDLYIDQIRAAEAEAKAAGRGLWSACESPSISADPPLVQPPAPPPADPQPVPPPPVSNCDASYPDFCIPPPPPDLDCGDIRRSMTVLQPDPHGFDGRPGQAGEPDGIGCESYG